MCSLYLIPDFSPKLKHSPPSGEISDNNNGDDDDKKTTLAVALVETLLKCISYFSPSWEAVLGI